MFPLCLLGMHTPEGYLPRNVRLVTNQFRAGPNGLVSGFNYPALHEYNWYVGQQAYAVVK